MHISKEPRKVLNNLKKYAPVFCFAAGMLLASHWTTVFAQQATQAGPPPSIMRKAHCVEAQVEKWQTEGKDPQPIGDIMQDLDPLMKEQKFAEAEAVLDHALRVAGGTCPEQSASTPVAGGRGNNNKEPDPIDFDDHDGFVQIFDGTTLNSWDGNPDVWGVEDGAIVGHSTPEKPAGNTFIVYHGTEAKDFDLKLEIKIEMGGGSGINYRSSLGLPPANPAAAANAPPRNPKWNMIGPQFDYWLPMNSSSSQHSGQLYAQNTGRGVLTFRGQVVEIVPGKAPRLIGVIGDRDALGGYNKFQDWNQLTLIVRGGTFIQIMNGRLMAAMIDDDPASSNNQPGLIGLQIEGTPPVKVSFRNIWLKKIS